MLVLLRHDAVGAFRPNADGRLRNEKGTPVKMRLGRPSARNIAAIPGAPRLFSAAASLGKRQSLPG
jgi:hypothetical protein